MPVTTLKNVVLPEPFGPIRPRISFGATREIEPVERDARRRNAWIRPRASSSARHGRHPGKIAAHRARQQSLRPEQQHRDHHQRVEQEAIFLDGLQFLRHDHDDDRRDDQAPRIADAAEQQDRDQDQRVGEGVVVRRDEAADHAEQRAGNADEEIADQERGDLPARDIEAEAARRGLVEPQRVEIEPDPGALQPPHQNEGADQQQQADDEIVHVERQRDAADLDVVVERPAENLHARHLHALRAAEHVVDLEKGLEQQREGDGHHRGVVPARAQHRQQQQRADQRRQQAADQQHQQDAAARYGR